MWYYSSISKFQWCNRIMVMCHQLSINHQWLHRKFHGKKLHELWASSWNGDFMKSFSQQVIPKNNELMEFTYFYDVLEKSLFDTAVRPCLHNVLTNIMGVYLALLEYGNNFVSESLSAYVIMCMYYSLWHYVIPVMCTQSLWLVSGPNYTYVRIIRFV